MWPEHCNFVFMVLHMSGCHLYLRCCYCFDLEYCPYYQVEMIWMFVSNYLHIMYEQTKMTKKVS